MVRRKSLTRKRPIRVRESGDPTRGLQGDAMTGDAWLYRPGPKVKPAGTRHPYGIGRADDIEAIRRRDARAAGEPQRPHCSDCGAALDPQWCDNLAADDVARMDAQGIDAPGAR